MPVVQLSESWDAGESLESATNKLTTFLSQQAMKTSVHRAGGTCRIVAEQGSRLRFGIKTVLFADPKDLPKRATIRLMPQAGGLRIQATIEETLSTLPVLESRIKNQYREFFRRWMSSLRGIFVAPSDRTPEAEALFELAQRKWNEASEAERDDALKRDVASLLALAINKAGGSLPEAHSWLAIFLEDMGQEDDALNHANIALQLNPNDFRAQLVRIDVSLGGVRIRKLGLDDFYESVGDWAENLAASMLKGLLSVGGSMHASRTQAAFRDELTRLIQIFGNACQTNTDVDEFLYMAEMMIAYGDLVSGIPLTSGRPNLYAPVTQAPIDRLDMQGRDQAVMEVRARAEGRSLLFKE